MTERPAPRLAKKYLAMILAGGVAGVLVGLAGVYGISTLTGNAGGDASMPAGGRIGQETGAFGAWRGGRR